MLNNIGNVQSGLGENTIHILGCLLTSSSGTTNSTSQHSVDKFSDEHFWASKKRLILWWGGENCECKVFKMGNKKALDGDDCECHGWLVETLNVTEEFFSDFGIVEQILPGKILLAYTCGNILAMLVVPYSLPGVCLSVNFSWVVPWLKN